MPFVSDGRKMIRRAFEGNYAMPAFNIGSLVMARACIEAAEAEQAPIILQTSPGELTQTTPDVFSAMIRALANKAEVPIMLHLDHGDGLDRIAACINAGYSSVMFDGDSLTLEENVTATRNYAEWAHALGVSLEAAAGSFGGGEEGADSGVNLTNPDVARRLLKDGCADMVACSVGSVHGHTSKLDLGRLEAIAKLAEGPLVLHGGTGIPASDLAVATTLGVVKVNIGAGLARPIVKRWQDATENVASPHKGVFGTTDRVLADLIEVARDKIRIMNGSGQA